MRLPRFTIMQLLLTATLVALVLGLFTTAWRAGGPRFIDRFCFSLSGKFLAARSSTGVVQVWRLDEDQPRLILRESAFDLPHPKNDNQWLMECMCFLDDGRLLLFDGGIVQRAHVACAHEGTGNRHGKGFGGLAA